MKFGVAVGSGRRDLTAAGSRLVDVGLISAGGGVEALPRRRANVSRCAGNEHGRHPIRVLYLTTAGGRNWGDSPGLETGLDWTGQGSHEGKG